LSGEWGVGRIKEYTGPKKVDKKGVGSKLRRGDMIIENYSTIKASPGGVA